MERVTLLLQELVIESLLASLFGLLLDLTGTELRLRALQASRLRTLPETGESLRSTGTHAIALLSQRRLLLSCREALPELLLAEALQTLRLLAVKTRQRLSESRLLLCRAGAHAESLLAEPSEALTGLLQCCTVSLISCEVHTLLLLECAQRLPIAALQ